MHEADMYAHLDSRLTHLVPSNAKYSLRLAYVSYFLRASPNALQDLKQCLHYDPDSKLCKRAHKLLRSLERDASKARNYVDSSTWRSAIKILVGSGDDVGLIKRFEDALHEAVKEGYLPASFDATNNSQARLGLYQLACKANVGMGSVQGIKRYCQAVLSMRGGEDDIDALVGKGDVAMKEERWEEAVRVLADAFEKSGRSSQEVNETPRP
jgi:DnaJ family protein C protein 3